MPDFEYEGGAKEKLKEDYAVPNKNKYRDKDANDVSAYMSETRTQTEAAQAKADANEQDITNLQNDKANDNEVLHTTGDEAKTGSIEFNALGERTTVSPSEVKVDALIGGGKSTINSSSVKVENEAGTTHTTIEDNSVTSTNGSNTTTVKPNEVKVDSTGNSKSTMTKDGLEVTDGSTTVSVESYGISQKEGGDTGSLSFEGVSNNPNVNIPNKDGLIALTSDLDNQEALLLTGSDAYTHAKRGQTDGFTVDRLVQLDNTIEENLLTPFKSTFGHGKGVNKIGTAIPDSSNADFGFQRNSKAWFINKRGLLEEAAANVPRFDWSRGYPVLMKETAATQKLKNMSFANGGVGIAPTDWNPTILTFEPVASIFGNLVNAYKFSAVNSRPYFTQSPLTVAENELYVFSFFCESIEGDLDMNDVVWAFFSRDTLGFDKTDIYGNVTEITSSDNLESGYFYSIKVKSTENSTSAYFRLGAGVRSNVTAEITISIPQFELGSYRTSTIVDSTYTRLSETGVVTGDISSLINLNGFVLNQEIAANSENSAYKIMSLTDGTDTNTMRTMFTNSENEYKQELKIGNSALFSFFGIVDIFAMNKFQSKLKPNDYEFKLNGVLVFYDSNGTDIDSDTFDRMSYYRGAASEQMFCDTKSLGIESLESFNSTSTTIEEVKQSINNYTFR